ncbi:MAG: CPBP family intramembrane metalloprotease [Chloroflexi bacterium]|nr:CPBP family intramembrane metalloprotease [Chloroflexota bacterium]
MTIAGVQFDLKITFLIVLGTIVPMLNYYGHKFTGIKAYDQFIWYFVVPMLLIVFIFRESPADYGFRMGKWQIGLAWVVGACTGMALILWFVARQPGMQQYYQSRAPRELWQIIYFNGVELFGWEFIWRGLMLFAFARAFGPGPAIFLQAVPFAFMHLGKPEVETLSTIFGGAGFGFIAWQSESFLYPWLIHWFIATFTMVIATRV